MADSATLAEVRAVAAGEGAYVRGSAFEPLLVPLVAPYIADELVGPVCTLGRAVSRSRPQHGWPLLGLAVARALAGRINVDTAAAAITQLPDLVLFIDEPLVALSPTVASPSVVARRSYRRGEQHELLLPAAHLAGSPDPVALVLGLERMAAHERDAAITQLRDAIGGHEVDRRLLVDSLSAPYSSDFAAIAREALLLLDVHVPAWYWTTIAAHLGVFARGHVDDVSAAGRLPAPWAELFRRLLTEPRELDIDDVPVQAHPYGERLVELLEQLSPEEATRVAAEILGEVSSRWAADITSVVPVVPGGPAPAAPHVPPPPHAPAPAPLPAAPAPVLPLPSPPRRKLRWWNRRERYVGRGNERRAGDGHDAVGAEPPDEPVLAFPDGPVFALPDAPPAAAPDAPAAAAQPPPPPPPPAEPPARSLQADITVATDDGRPPMTVSTSFARGRVHTVAIWIGHRADDHRETVTADGVFVEGAVVHSGESASLELTLAHGKDTTTRPLVLPKDRSMPSRPVQFQLFVGDDEHNVLATITVEQNTRVLQQAVLVGVVTDEPDGSTATRIDLQVQTSARPLDDTTSELHFDTSLTTPRGDAPIIIRSDGVASVPQPWDDGLRAEIATIGGELFATAKVQAGGNVADSWPNLISFLALHGKQLYRWLMDHGYEGLAQATSIQLTDADPSRPLPIELVYDGEGPALDAKPCAGWEQALVTGTCSACAPEAPDEQAICPLHFWGLSKIIERQTGVATTQAREVKPLGGTLFAASGNVRDEDVESTVAALTEACGAAPFTSTTWPDVKRAVEGHRPSLLVLMPHQAFDQEKKIDVLEIGHGSPLPAGQVSEAHVKVKDGAGPLVLLLGCKTAAASVSYLNFVAEFRNRGAAMVVGTTATVLGRDVAPIAQCIVAELASAARAPGAAQQVGSLLLRARRQMIADENAAAFALVAFGDADLTVKGA